MNRSVQVGQRVVGQASCQIRPRPDPYGGLTHLTILVNILTSVTSPSAVHGPSVTRCMTMRCWDNCSSNSFCCVLVPDTRRRV